MDIEKAFNSFYHIFAICVLKKFAFSSGNFWQTWRTFQTQTKNIKKKLHPNNDCNGIRTDNHLVRKRTLSHLAKLTK